MSEAILITEGKDNRHIVLKISQGDSPIGKIAIVEDHLKNSKKIPTDDGINITAWLVFDFNKTEDVKAEDILTEIIKQALLYIKGIEGDDLIFEKLKIKPETDELKIAAGLIGFEPNGNEELILSRENFLTATSRNSKDEKYLQTDNATSVNQRVIIPERHCRNSAKKPVPNLMASREAQTAVLQALLKIPGKITIKSIREQTGLAMATVISIISAFKRCDLVEKKQDDNDGRALTIIPDRDAILEILNKIGVMAQKPVSDILRLSKIDSKPPNSDPEQNNPPSKHTIKLPKKEIPKGSFNEERIPVVKEIVETLAKDPEKWISVSDISGITGFGYPILHKCASKLNELEFVEMKRQPPKGDIVLKIQAYPEKLPE